jgi:hypothetical protein
MWRPCMDRNTGKGCGSQMKEYELDKSTGEVIWKEDLSKVLELEKMLQNSHLEKYVEQINNNGFKETK